ncbi:MAG: folylpolyglutamate synthase/dihydrofolate synthase family protein [Pseudomonadota bacterium]
MQLPFWPSPSSYRNIELGLSRTYQLLARLNNPHLKIPPTIHLAGTNGKGSTLAYLRAILEDAGLQVHCYISPHLVRFNERIILAGKEIADDFLNEILQECQAAAEIEPKINVTFFEGITVAAFVAFSKIKADVLLLETGMGGRLDATNVIANPLATIITPIAFDHTEFLGTTLKQIAFEKAGIIKPQAPVIISKQKPSALKVLQDVALKNGSEVFNFDQNYNLEISPSLAGEHQIINAKTAIAAIFAQKKFKISAQNIQNGIKKAVWQARLQKILAGKFYQILPQNFQLILDGSHNSAGAKTIENWLKDQQKKSSTKNYLICAMLKDKDSHGFLKHLAKQTEMLIGLKIADEEKSKSAGEIVKIAQTLNMKAKSALEFYDAIAKIKEYHLAKYPKEPAQIIICGSLYLAGKFLEEN